MRVRPGGTGVELVSRQAGGSERRLAADRVVAATGFRPDHAIAAELRLDLDPILGTTRLPAPLIDPNDHSCGTVRPHGVDELTHPEPGYYAIGMKSYGRAPAFLLATGDEQARSAVAALDRRTATGEPDEREALAALSGCLAPLPAVLGERDRQAITMVEAERPELIEAEARVVVHAVFTTINDLARIDHLRERDDLSGDLLATCQALPLARTG